VRRWLEDVADDIGQTAPRERQPSAGKDRENDGRNCRCERERGDPWIRRGSWAAPGGSVAPRTRTVILRHRPSPHQEPLSVRNPNSAALVVSHSRKSLA
jgi:hypothetical protein